MQAVRLSVAGSYPACQSTFIDAVTVQTRWFCSSLTSTTITMLLGSPFTSWFVPTSAAERVAAPWQPPGCRTRSPHHHARDPPHYEHRNRSGPQQTPLVSADLSQKGFRAKSEQFHKGAYRKFAVLKRRRPRGATRGLACAGAAGRHRDSDRLGSTTTGPNFALGAERRQRPSLAADEVRLTLHS